VSQSIWTQCGGVSSLRALKSEPWRVVEAQHVLSTRKLVDSADEQQLLEALVDGVKPPVPAEPAFEGLHYLLFTPFRHPPLRHGSRFGTRFARGIWYGAESLPTAFAESAYYRFLFLQGTAATLPRLLLELSAFTVPVATKKGVDLTAPPFDAHARKLTSRTTYRNTQLLGAQMREAGVEAFRFRSARDPSGGMNLGVLQPGAFARKTPRRLETWICDLTFERAEFSRKNLLAPAPPLAFHRTGFEVGGKLPSPAA
jgi:hypothetical protein